MLHSAKRRELDAGVGSRFSPSQITRYTLDIVKGLEFLHKQGIIHRDLKVSFSFPPPPKVVILFMYFQSDNIFVTLTERKEINNLAIGDFDTGMKERMLTRQIPIELILFFYSKGNIR